MAIQLSGVWLPDPCTIPGHSLQLRNNRPSPTALAAASLPFSQPSIQIVGGKTSSWYENGNGNYNGIIEGAEGETDWVDLDADLNHWTKVLRPVQWYPGHIAKTEKELKEQLKLMDVVIEVRVARIPMSTSHPQTNVRSSSKTRCYKRIEVQKLFNNRYKIDTDGQCPKMHVTFYL